MISYDVDGAREVVLPETGVLLRPARRRRPRPPRSSGSPPTPRSAGAMGREGRRRFAHQFRHETMTSQLRSLYERLLPPPHPSNSLRDRAEVVDGASRVHAPAEDVHSTSPGRARSMKGWGWSLLIGTAVLLICSANRREIGSSDTVPATFLPLALIRGDGPFLDRFAPMLRSPQGHWPHGVQPSMGHIVSRYPLGAALVAVPLEWPQVWALDRLRPDWERGRHLGRDLSWMTKNAAALIAALLGVVLHRLLLAMGLERVALPSVLAASLGSPLWCVASQSLWQHGPAALALDPGYPAALVP